MRLVHVYGGSNEENALLWVFSTVGDVVSSVVSCITTQVLLQI